MKHKISAGALIFHEKKLLMVRHVEQGKYDFWVPPGGGVEGTESIKSAAIRETKEETGLIVRPLSLAYIQEGIWPDHRICKFWFYCEWLEKDLAINSAGVIDQNLVDARFMSQAELNNYNVVPELVKEEIWRDYETGFPETKLLEIENWDMY